MRHGRSEGRRFVRSALVILASVFVIVAIFQFTEAGSLAPSLAPSGTLNTLDELYVSLTGSYDSTAIVAAKHGDVLQVSKCIIQKITGGTPCP